MNMRKFFLIFCSVISSFMFILGVASLGYINLSEVSADEYTPNNSSIISDILDPYKTVAENVNVLVLGGDKVAKNTDTMMLVNFNPTTAKINILSIPRDTKVRIKNKTSKINAAYPLGGGEQAIESVSNLLGVDINYYVYIDTSTFRKIIDILDGVDYYVPEDMDYDDPLQNLHIHLKKGQQRLNGEKAEQFMRFRQNNRGKVTKNYDGSDLKRIEAQQNFIRELIRQKVNIVYITKMNNILNVVFNNIDTNITLDEVLKLSKNINKVNADEITMLKLPGESAYINNIWYYEMDREQASEIISQYFREN
ncbi:LCP family protein [Acetivibrio clariflavus]|uniref:Cell envelope-related function transcriptional attenuator common domain protein n=1 Tax=Acetivibrio clariflavus (strain DSM 19732 / NBRC 101661 / EBR45) TaxID=720554 RepID=G8LU52_ACECE|nr:LCP family protein [Acetivibrio clariflavus]AEV68440.1 cell envelope-related function transcriptional attenuator common domain protein [Acetivibrio clariflavus DSM 19732]